MDKPKTICLRSIDEGLLITLWEKEKMLVISIFFFSHNFFYPIKDKFHDLIKHFCFVWKAFVFGKIKKNCQKRLKSLPQNPDF